MAAKSGDPCGCGAGRLAVASSQRSGDYQTRYLRCTACGKTAKQIVKAAEVRRLKSFTVASR